MLGFAACTNDVTEDVAVAAPETLIVSFEENSRVQLQNDKTVWTAGDQVSVFYLSNANQKWKFQGQTGDRMGNIKRISTPEATQEMTSVVVVYPYNENYYINPRTCNVKAFMPAEQTYLKDSYGLNGNIMVSQSEYKQFALKSVCGWLKIQLKGEGQVVKKITLKGNNGEQVAGELYINTADATAVLAAEQGSTSNDNEVGGTMFEDDTILTDVTLVCPDGVTLGSETTAFYIALPPQEFSNGFTITVNCSDGSQMIKSTENKIAVERNTIQPLSAIMYDGIVPPVYELAYTTNDGNPLDPCTTEGFGSDFVENIYDATIGSGTLKFSGKITTIPTNAFLACTNLTWIDIPNTITEIGDGSFNGCSSVEQLTIPSSITSIGKSSFENCAGKVTINCNISYHYNYGYFQNAKFTEVIIGDSVTEIGASAFYGCSNLESITIPDSVISIGRSAFYGCINLRSVTIPNGLTLIDMSTFVYCSSLTSITIPDSVLSIGSGAFQYCNSIKNVYINDLSAWCKVDFDFGSNPLDCGAKLYLNNVEVTELTIPSDITEIKNSTFSGCSSLTSVIIHNKVSSIGEGAFSFCRNLTSVTIGNRVTSIGDAAFSNCGFENINIPNSVTSIGSFAFMMCNNLTSITIPENVQYVAGSAFQNCRSLKYAYCKPITPPATGYNPFGDEEAGKILDDGIIAIYVPRVSVDAYKMKDGWNMVADYIQPYDFE